MHLLGEMLQISCQRLAGPAAFFKKTRLIRDLQSFLAGWHSSCLPLDGRTGAKIAARPKKLRINDAKTTG
jgi:hypothetical protein